MNYFYLKLIGVQNSYISARSNPNDSQHKNQLDFLLSKASQYSNFISRDLEELQAAMTDSAQRAAEKADKKNKKRKGDGKGRGGKKVKNNNGDSAEALQSAQLKDANNRKEGKRVIFTQPPNLAKGCVLKDYQLEGVRWLASLFENGVSGILADEVSTWVTSELSGLALTPAPIKPSSFNRSCMQSKYKNGWQSKNLP